MGILRIDLRFRGRGENPRPFAVFFAGFAVQMSAVQMLLFRVGLSLILQRFVEGAGDGV